MQRLKRLNWGTKVCCVFLLCATAAIALPAQTFTTLHSFDGMDGKYPEAGLVQATNGDLYGTTNAGGGPGACKFKLACGTIFKITLSGKQKTLYNFCPLKGCTDGNDPVAALVQSIDGSLYGITNRGGANDDGTVFKITAKGTLTTLHSFDGMDGSLPFAALAQGTDGNFYGITEYGGANDDGGTVFKITPSGRLTTLYNFCSQVMNNVCTDGGGSFAALVQATNGNFYGTTSYGGANNVGTVFKITPSGTLTTLHSFDKEDGAYPGVGLVQAIDGNLYGATGGGANNDGTVFKITPRGALTTLHTFDGTDGTGPNALIQATDGNFYGTTDLGGANGGGTIFKITSSGTLTTLYNYCLQADNCPNGGYPFAALVQDTNGTFYGTTQHGGANDLGTLFSFSMGLGPFVEAQPGSGAVGTAVTILGTNLSSVTNVRFNGIESEFTVVSTSEITTTVPKGATTGPVRVIMPSGKLQSNVAFRVKP
jgi:uncharacterized repeat protein (TIGR03803 family)